MRALLGDRARLRFVSVAMLIAPMACGGPIDSDIDPSATAAASGAAQGSGGGSSAAVGAGGDTSGGPTTASGQTTASGSGGSSHALATLGTLVILGDSIGDGGGQPPYYYGLLRDSLAAHYALSIEYRNKADSGSKTSALLAQVNALPNTLPGPVAVAITSGGNDMKDNLVAILTGSDGPARAKMGDNIDTALDALLSPDRFGAGTSVHVYYANIYDASDGQGNFKSGGCVVNIDSPSPTDPFFASWNGEIADRVADHAQLVADMHKHFQGHGFNHPPNWYASDCTHPNTTGHDQVRQMFFESITGQAF
jgi:lysophospholipase L1-like esterase